MISCKEATERLSRARDGSLEWHKYPGLWFRRAICGATKTYCKQMRFLERICGSIDEKIDTGDYAADISLPDDTKQRIKLRMQAERQQTK